MKKGLIYKIQLFLQSQVNSVRNPAGSAGLGPWIAALLAPGRSQFLLDHSQSVPTTSGWCPIDAVLPAASWMVHNCTAAHTNTDLFLVPGSFPALESPLDCSCLMLAHQAITYRVETPMLDHGSHSTRNNRIVLRSCFGFLQRQRRRIDKMRKQGKEYKVNNNNKCYL